MQELKTFTRKLEKMLIKHENKCIKIIFNKLCMITCIIKGKKYFKNDKTCNYNKGCKQYLTLLPYSSSSLNNQH